MGVGCPSPAQVKETRMRKLTAGLITLALAASPAMAQMGGGMGGGGMGGGMGGGGMGGGRGSHGGDMGEAPSGGGDHQPRDMKPIALKTFDKAVESMFRIADANHDGIVTLAEFESVVTARRAAVIRERFHAIDANHDGRIDEAEFIAWESRKGSAAMVDDTASEFSELVPDSIGPDLGEGERNVALMIAVEPLNPVVIARANTNYNAGITLDELMTYEHLRFTKADTNQDGFLEREEIEALLPGRSGHHDGFSGGRDGNGPGRGPGAPDGKRTN